MDSDTDSEQRQLQELGTAIAVQACDHLGLFRGPGDDLAPAFSVLGDVDDGVDYDSDDEDPFEYARWIASLHLDRSVETGGTVTLSGVGRGTAAYYFWQW